MSAAFTLIELLVAVAVIGIVASLLLAGLAQAKAQTRSIACRNNLRQLSLEVLFYVSDFGVFPTSDYVYTNIVGTSADWLKASLKEDGIRHCPARTPDTNTAVIFSANGSYGYNAAGYVGPKGARDGPFGLGGYPVSGSFRGLPEGEVVAPADMLALGDNFGLLPQAGNDFARDVVIESFLNFSRQEIAASRGGVVRNAVKRAEDRHRRRGNVAFCDGHAESMKFEGLFFDRTDTSLRRWNRDHQPHW